MRFWVGITDEDWYRSLSSQPRLDEVNFWQPGGTRVFRALAPGELFLFKLHAPRHAIVGGGVFAHATTLPSSLAWEAFGPKNGAATMAQMRARIEKYRKQGPPRFEDYVVGCILLEQPFFLPESEWIPAPEDWKPNIVQGKTYGLDSVAGHRLWTRLQTVLATFPTDVPLVGATAPPFDSAVAANTHAEPSSRYGAPFLAQPRLGQGSFRVVVTDTYERRCAVTRERTLPALEAAHIRPYSEDGEHRVDNGLLLRRDLHALFDRGYLTVTPDLRLEVSRRIREDFENGRDYYAMQGRELWTPKSPSRRPAAEFLRWHNEGRFLG